MKVSRLIGCTFLLCAACGGEQTTTEAASGNPPTATATGAAPTAAPTATANATATATATAPATATGSASAKSPMKNVGEGGTCGGIAALMCADGLTCKMTGPAHPDQAGTCVPAAAASSSAKAGKPNK